MAENHDLERSIRLSIAEGALATVMSSLTTGVFLTGFALALGASRLQIGILAALPTLASFAQLAGSYVIERKGESKPLCMTATTAGRLMWLPVLATPLLANAATRVWMVTAVMGVSCVLAAIGGVAWLAWIRDLIPRAERITFFGRRNVFNMALSLTLTIVGGIVIDGWERIAPGSPGGFIIVFAIATGCGLFGLTILSRIPEPIGLPAARPQFYRLVCSLCRERNFRRLTSFYAVSSLATQMATPFFAVYMLENLGLPFWFVTFVSVLASVAGMWATGFWARMTRRFGTKPVAFAAGLGDAFIPLAWIFVDRPWVWVLIPLHLSGVFNAPLTMNRDDLVLKLAPQRNGTPYMAMFNAVVGPAGALGAILGGFLSTEFSTLHWSAGSLTFGGLKLLFLISFVGRLVSLAFLRDIVEPESKPMRRIVRTLTKARRKRRLERLRQTSQGRAA